MKSDSLKPCERNPLYKFTFFWVASREICLKMGNGCSSCFKGDETVIVQPDMAARRQMQVEAAERRRQEAENRGIKDPEKVRRMQERAAKLEKDELEAAKLGMAKPGLKWQAD